MRGTIVALLGAAILVTPAIAKDRPAGADSALLKGVADCRAIAVDAERLRCFDFAAGRLQTAIDRKDLYVMEKSQVQATRRTLFGLPLPSLGIFGDEDKDAAPITQIDSTVRSASLGGDGNWVVALDDGSTWRQTDSVELGFTPKRGQKVNVKRAMFNSFRMSIDGRPPVRVKRAI